MDNVIERIARFADIDTRRAMGFKPRKLHVPDIKFVPPCLCLTVPPMIRWDFESGIQFSVGFADPLHKNVNWYIGDKLYHFCLDCKEMWCSDDGEIIWRYIHPDFNDDGSFKRAQPL